MKILAFGIAKEIVGGSSFEMDFNNSVNVGNLRRTLNERYPRLSQLSSYFIAVNDEYAQNNMQISDSDEVAIIPPVSGG